MRRPGAMPAPHGRGAFSGCSHGGSRRQKRPDFRQQFLKAFAGAAGAGVFSAELFEQFLVAMNDPHAAFDVRFGWEAALALTGALESRAGRAGVTGFAWDTSGGELHGGTWPANSATIVTCAWPMSTPRRKGTSRISPHSGASADLASFSEPSFPPVSLSRIFWMSPFGVFGVPSGYGEWFAGGRCPPYLTADHRHSPRQLRLFRPRLHSRGTDVESILSDPLRRCASSRWSCV